MTARTGPAATMIGRTLATVRGRVLAAALLIETVMLAIMVANGVRLLDTSMSEQAAVTVGQIAPVLTAALVAPMLQGDRATVQAILDESRQVDSVTYLAVADAAGKTIAASGWPAGVPLPEPRAAKPFDNAPRRDIARDLVFAGQHLGRLHFAIDLTGIARARHNLLLQGVTIATLEVLASALTLGVLGAWLTRHLRALESASDDVARGHFDFPPVVESRDEIGRLGAAFNAMSRAVRRRQEEMAALNAELRALGMVAAHHLQEPVRPLVSYSQLIARHCPRENVEVDEWLRYVHDAGTRLKSLLRDFERYLSLLSQSPVPATHTLEELVRAAGDRALASADGILLTRRFAPGLEVTADGTMLVELFAQLFDNANSHRGRRKRIGLTVCARRVEGVATVTVADDGPGIPPDLLDRVVRPFEKVDAARPQSTGFGLAFCAVVVRSHGGTMTIASDAGGTAVTFTLPDALPATPGGPPSL